jgi:pimeloyl-ACP methyl ester carboxylesterase
MASMETVASRDGTPIAFERGGEGPPLVLVHGTTSDHLTWELVLPDLQKLFTVYAIDRRGHGESGDGYDIEREFEDVVAVIDSIGGTVGLLGHSYGAICALEAALRSDQVRRLILYEGTFPVPKGIELYPPEAFDSVRSSLKAGDREAALTTFYRDIALISPGEIEMLRSLPVWQARVALAPTIPHEMRAFENYVSSFDPARLANLSTPTLILLGGDSPALEKAAAEALDAALLLRDALGLHRLAGAAARARGTGARRKRNRHHRTRSCGRGRAGGERAARQNARTSRWACEPHREHRSVSRRAGQLHGDRESMNFPEDVYLTASSRTAARSLQRRSKTPRRAASSTRPGRHYRTCCQVRVRRIRLKK